MGRMYRVVLPLATVVAAGAAAVVTAQSQAQEAQKATSVTFHKEVLPILQKNCQTCHRPGSIAPMSLLTYDDARPWARSMKVKVASRQMPPWFADPQYGNFANDRSLKQADIDTIVKWADSGAPAGDPKDAPAPIAWPADGWQIKPDVIVRGPAFQIPAHPPQNVIEWTSIVVPSGFTKDTWITSMELKPSDISVTHHICINFRPHTPDVQYYTPAWNDKLRDEEGIEIKKPGEATPTGDGRNTRDTQSGRSNGLEICYLPGDQAADYRPYHAGKLIPAGTDIVFQVHYTPSGKDAIDVPLLGFTVADTPPEKRWISTSAGGAGVGAGGQDSAAFVIPPNEPNYAAPPAEAELGADAELVMFQPHMHVRGKDMTYTVEFPDGKRKVVLSVSKYDFNWQLQYMLAEPLRLPKGTKLHVQAHYNNSTSNKYNPNPNRTIYQGNMTWEEMMSPFMAILVDVKTDPTKVFKRRTAQAVDGGD